MRRLVPTTSLPAALLAALRHRSDTGMRVQSMPVSNAEQEVLQRAAARRARRKKTVETEMSALLEKMVEIEGPSMDLKPKIDKAARAKAYEAEFGRPPPSTDTEYHKSLPFPPSLYLRRIERHTLYDNDPFPARSVTEANPVKNRHQAAMEKEERERLRREKATDAHGVIIEDLDAQMREEDAETKKMFGIGEGVGVSTVEEPSARFVEAIDELAHWEQEFLAFLRQHSLPLRRTLPLLQEQYRHLAHRLVRAIEHFAYCRDQAAEAARIDSAVYAKTEARLQRSQKVLVETMSSVSARSNEPAKMKKYFTGKILRLDNNEYREWQSEDRRERHLLAAEFL